jgi:predicted small secreted protein
MIKKLLILALLVGTANLMVACETMEGAGQDTKHAGQALENAADRNK